MPHAARITLLLEEQAEELDELDEEAALALLLLLRDAQRDLAARLAAMEATGLDAATPFTAQHVRVVKAQIDDAVRQLGERMGEALDETARKAGEMAHKHLIDVIKVAEPNFRDAGNQIDWAIVRRLSEERGLLLHEHSLRRYGAETIERMQRALAQGMLQGENLYEIRQRLLREIQGLAEARAELIARMELNRAYNLQHQAALEEAAEVLDEPGGDDPLMRQADEYFDRRNHPISRALHGRVTGIKEPWRVPVGAVVAGQSAVNAARKGRGLPKRRLGGVLWPVEAGHYVIWSYPVHFNERGRQVPYRPSWDDGEALRRFAPLTPPE